MSNSTINPNVFSLSFLWQQATTESMNEKFGQEEETDDYYEFTAEDYYKLLATKKEGNIDHSNSNQGVAHIHNF